ncbi:hypothetical protein GCM10010174_07630 [Kutzneria viridogrisea]
MCGSPGGDPVVHDDDVPVSQAQLGTISTQTPRAGGEFHEFVVGHSPQFHVGDTGPTHHVLVENPNTALPDGSHRQFGLERNTEFADHDHVQRRVEVSRDFEGDWNTTTGNTEYQYALTAQACQPLS